MTYAPAAPEFDRLPWLNDERKPPARKGLDLLVLWSIAALLLIAGASYWVGMTSATDRVGSDGQPDGASSATIALPEPSAAEAVGNDVSRPAMPEVEPVAPPRPVTIAKPRPTLTASRSERSSAASRKLAIRSRSAEARAAARASSLAANKAEQKAEPLEVWPAEQSEGAAGRAVRIGTFSSRSQAKRGWRQLVRSYPGMGRLQAVVVPNPSLRNGRTYYRLQFGTTSQAHSAILCQWMRSIAQSCVVIGQPAKSS